MSSHYYIKTEEDTSLVKLHLKKCLFVVFVCIFCTMHFFHLCNTEIGNKVYSALYGGYSGYNYHTILDKSWVPDTDTNRVSDIGRGKR